MVSLDEMSRLTLPETNLLRVEELTYRETVFRENGNKNLDAKRERKIT